MIKGQEKLCKKIDSHTMDTFPRTLLLLGEYGSGRHSIVKYIADRFKCEVEDISGKLTLEYIDTINQRVTPMIYVIDSKELTIKNENVILKFLEEPLKNAFIVVLSENKYNIIPTILNRCLVWELETYNMSLLRQFISSDVDVEVLLRVATTPGKVIKYQTYPIDEMIKLATKIFTNIGKANIANALTLSKYVAFKDEKDKFDFNLFLDVLLMVSRDLCHSKFDKCFQIYGLTNELNNNKYLFNVDKKALFEHYLVELKLLTIGDR